MEWMLLPLKRYAEFSGRSRRMEYWMFTLFTVIVYIVLAMVMLGGGLDLEALASDSVPEGPGVLFWVGGGLFVIFVLAIIIPSIAVTIRRLHDRDMSGWWYLGAIVAGLIPYVGFIASLAFLVLMFLPGTVGPNRFGDDPKSANNASVFE